MSFLENLTWRNATKSFDKNRKIGEPELEKVLNAVQMAPTSFGLQPFYVVVVSDESTRQQMHAAGWNQDQFLSASFVLVFVRTNEVSKRIDDWLSVATGGRADMRASFKAFEDMTRGWLKGQTPERIDAWTARQAYIAMGFGLAACAELRIDSCPIEGFDPAKFDEILRLPSSDHATVVLAIGHRNQSVAPHPKVRLPTNVLFKRQ